MSFKAGRHWVLSAVVFVLLVGCEPEVSTEAARTPAGESRTTSSASLQSLLNFERTSVGLGPVNQSGKLTAAAVAHANDMSVRGYFSHVSAGGAALGQRIRAQGYGFCVVAENIAKGQTSKAEVVRVWMRSPGHRRNILNPAVTEFGIGRAPGNYWVLVLAGPGC
jgi:uncharacterized protein YkwD